MFRNKGLTLVELLITIAVVAVLSATIASYSGTSQKYARDQQRRADLNAVGSVMEIYRNDKGFYPNCATSAYCDLSSLQATLQSYINTLLPPDPKDAIYNYIYYPLPVNCNNTSFYCSTFRLCAVSEKDDTDADNNCGGFGVCGSDKCTIVITNP